MTVHPVYNPYMTGTLIPSVESQSDFIIYLSHNPDGVDYDPIAARMLDKHSRKVPIIGGHSHQVMPSTLAQYAKVVKAGVHGACIGSTRVRWNPNSKTVESVTGMNYDIDHNKYLDK